MSNYVIKTGANGELTPIQIAAIDSIVNAPDNEILVTGEGATSGQFISKNITVSDNNINAEFSGTEVSQSISKTTDTDISNKIYGLGDNSALDRENLSIGWNSVDDSYQLETQHLGLGVKRQIDIVDTTVNHKPKTLELIQSVSNVVLDAVTCFVINNNYCFISAVNLSNNIVIMDISNSSNMKILNTIVNTFVNIPIVSYSQSNFTNFTTVDIGITPPPVGYQVTISGSTDYDGDFIIKSIKGTTFDIETPFTSDVVPKGTFSGQDFTRVEDLHVTGDLLYAGIRDFGLYCFDVSDVDNPILIGCNNTLPFADVNLRQMTVIGNKVFASNADTTNGLITYDVSNVRELKVLNTLPNTTSEGGVYIRDHHLYIFNQNITSLQIYDISDETNYILKDSLNDPNIVRISDSKMSGRYLFAFSITNNILMSYDVQNLTQIVKLSTLALGGAGFTTFQIFGDKILLSRIGIVYLIDISDPTNMQIIQSDTITGGRCFALYNNIFLTVDTATGVFLSYDFKPFIVQQIQSLSIDTTNLIVKDSLIAEKDIFVGGEVTISENLNISNKAFVNGQQIFGNNPDIVYVKTGDDFPAPSGGFHNLKQNTIYVMYNPNPELGQNTIDISNPIKFPDAGGCMITSSSLTNCVLRYLGASALFNTNVSLVGINSIYRISTSAPFGSLFDIKGTLIPSFEFLTRFICEQCALVSFLKIGTIETASVNLINSGFALGAGGLESGIIFKSCFEVNLQNTRFCDFANVADTIFVQVEGDFRIFHCSLNEFTGGNNITVFNIRPNINPDNQLLITGSVIDPNLTTFYAGDSGFITSITDASTAGTVSSVTGLVSSPAEFNTADPLPFVSQTVIHTGFTESSYNGTFICTVSGGGVYQLESLGGVSLEFVSNDTGTFTLNALLIATDTTSGLSETDIININDTINYNGSHNVFDITVNTSFKVSDTYISDESPTVAKWSSGSLTQKDIKILASGNGKIPNSIRFGFGEMNGNALTTSITDLTYDFVNVTGMVQSDISEEWVIIDFVEGIFRYDGIEDFSGTVTVIASMVKAGSTANYRIAVSKNSVIPVFATEPYASFEVKTSVVQVSLIRPISASTGDTIQIVVAGDGTADALTISDFLLNIA